MSENLRKKLRQAGWRLNLSRALSLGLWSSSICLAIACAIVLADQLFVWGIPWTMIVGGALGAAVIVTTGMTYITRRRTIDVALILDQQCQLKERLSTLVSLDDAEREQAVGRALVADVESRASQIDVAKSLPIKVSRWSWLPAIPAAVLMAIVSFVGPLDWATRSHARETSAAERERIAEETKQLAQRIKEQEKKLEEAGASEELKDVAAKIEKAAREINEDKKSSPEKAALKLSDLAKSIEEQRKKNGGLDRMKRALESLTGGEEGPASKLQESLKDGDFKEAAKQLKKLKEEIAKGNLSAEEKENCPNN